MKTAEQSSLEPPKLTTNHNTSQSGTEIKLHQKNSRLKFNVFSPNISKYVENCSKISIQLSEKNLVASEATFL